MEIIITQWALDSYLNLKHRNVFTTSDYRQILRPDVLRLKNYDPMDSKFQQQRFWSFATGYSGRISDGYKMKWHNLGPGRVQLRLPVGLIDDVAYLCEAYVKQSPQQDRRMMARFSVHLDKIRRRTFITRGRLQ